MEALNRGRALYAYEQEIQKQRTELKKMYASYDAFEEEIGIMEAELVSDGVSPRRRMKLLKEINRLEADQRYYSEDIAEMEQVLEDMQENLNQLKGEDPYP